MKRSWRFLDWVARPFHVAAQIQFEPSDLWVGIFWRFRRVQGAVTGWDRHHGTISGEPWSLHLYVCLLPCVPLHVYVLRTLRPSDRVSRPPAFGSLRFWRLLRLIVQEWRR